jgi:hypothetical protein
MHSLVREVSLTVAPSDLRLVGPFQGLYGTNYLCETELTVEPKLMVDPVKSSSLVLHPPNWRVSATSTCADTYLRGTLRS